MVGVYFKFLTILISALWESNFEKQFKQLIPKRQKIGRNREEFEVNTTTRNDLLDHMGLESDENLESKRT